MEQRSSLTPSMASAAEARWVTRTVLAAWGLSHLEEPACLLVSELVTNVVLHAATASELAFSLQRGTLHVSVEDHDPRPPILRHSSPWSTGGRGIALVDALADDWGWQPAGRGNGKTVWFDLYTRGARAQTWRPAAWRPVPAR